MARKFGCIVAALALAASLAAGGCRKEKKAAPAAPGSGGEQPQTMLPAPGNPPAGTLAAGPLTPPAPGGVDALDDPAPEVQNIFPKSGDILEWVKITPVRKYETLADMVGEAHADYYKPYGVDWSADMQYQLGRDVTRPLVVQLFHCQDSAGAYGLMSIGSDTPADAAIGQEARSGPYVRLHVWSGPYYLHLFSDRQQGPAFVSAMQKLAENIVGNLPAGGVMPSLVQRMPKRERLAAGVHWFKGPASLATSGLQSLDRTMEELAAVLQFGAGDELVIASYRTPDLPGATLMFVARYGSASAASEAYRRLDASAMQAASRLGRNLVVHPARGQFVFGTLTPEEYSRQLAAARSLPPTVLDDMPLLTTIDRRLSGQ